MDVLESAREGGWKVLLLNWPSGTPDLLLARGAQRLAVELKAGEPKLEPHQREILAILAKGGWEARVWTEACLPEVRASLGIAAPSAPETPVVYQTTPESGTE